MYLKWQATTAADLHWQCLITSCSVFFSYHVVTFLCFLGALSALQVALSVGCLVFYSGFMVLFQTWWKAHKNCEKSLSTAICSYWRQELFTQRGSAPQCFKQMLAAVELTAVATGGGCDSLLLVQYVLQIILCSYGLIPHLYLCLHFSQLLISVYVLISFIIDLCIFYGSMRK